MPRTIRSPPAAAPTTSTEELLPQELNYDSAPDLSTVGKSGKERANFVSNLLSKRRREVGTDELKNSIDEMRELLTNSMSQQDFKLTALMSTVTEIKQQNAEIQKTVDFLSEEHNNLKKKFMIMDNERKDQLLYIKTLEDKLENMERSSRSTGLEFRNFAQKTGEGKSDLISLVVKVSEKLQTPVQIHEIKDVFRTKTKNENKPIIVELTSVLKKEAILDSLKKFKRDRNGQLESSSLGIQGPSTRVFISETLTSKNKRLFALARDFAKTNSYKYCWTSHGYVFLRKSDGQPAIRITSEEDLAHLKTNI